ncbi:unnamed protein product [Phyllotreta striolata]|uniref:Rad21/Rec8-like protein N-terminal domain-containing protein n=1 Tax=Phyllotreta striolata TaxID=444603 RepID=A0A9N9TPR0_PHYSR|nr:unnamed protein product [Phyllotreta striolata]
MFYNLEFLSKQANPLLHRAWIVGTRGISAVTSKSKLTTSELSKLCDDILSFMSSQSNEAKDRPSIRLSNTLLLGTLDLFIDMVDAANRDMDEVLKRKKSVVKITEIGEGEEASPEITAVTAVKRKPRKERPEKKAPEPVRPVEENVLVTADIRDLEENTRQITLIDELPIQRMEMDEQLGLEPIPDVTRMEVEPDEAFHVARDTTQSRTARSSPEVSSAIIQVHADVHATELEERRGIQDIPMEVEEIPPVPEVPARKTSREHSKEIQPLPIEVHATVEPQTAKRPQNKREKRRLLHKQNFLKIVDSHRRKLASSINAAFEEPLEEPLEVGHITIRDILIEKGFLPHVTELGTEEPGPIRAGSVRSTASPSALVMPLGTSFGRETTPRPSSLRESTMVERGQISGLHESIPPEIPSELRVSEIEEPLMEPLVLTPPEEVQRRVEESWLSPHMEHAEIPVTEAPQLEPEHLLSDRERMIRQLQGNSSKIRRLQKILSKVSSWNFEKKLTIEDFVDQPLSRFVIAPVFLDLLELYALGYVKLHTEENSNELEHVTKGLKFDQSFELQ